MRDPRSPCNIRYITAIRTSLTRYRSNAPARHLLRDISIYRFGIWQDMRCQSLHPNINTQRRGRRSGGSTEPFYEPCAHRGSRSICRAAKKPRVHSARARMGPGLCIAPGPGVRFHATPLGSLAILVLRRRHCGASNAGPAGIPLLVAAAVFIRQPSPRRHCVLSYI